MLESVPSASSSSGPTVQPGMSSVNEKLVGPLGTVSLTMTIVPRSVLVKVQVTVSPSSRLMEAVRVPTLPVLLPSSQVRAVRSNAGVGSSSVTE